MINVTLFIGEAKRTLSYPGRVSLYDVMRDAGVPICAPCGGAGRCGGCRVTAAGELSEPDDAEKRLLGEALGRGIRLACRTFAIGDAEIYAVPDTYQNAPAESSLPDGEYGAALDIGTTTVAASLVDMRTGERVAEASAYNPQSAWGADVISRLGAIADGRTTVGEMSRLVRDTADSLCRALGAREDAPRVVVGNTVMMSLFAGIDPTMIGRAPFTPPTLFGEFRGRDYYPRCAGAYFGADAVASVLAVRERCRGDFMLCDIGTNGEVAAYRGGRLRASAAAAGPALEGAGISCGMRAVCGAIDSVKIEAGRISCSVIGGGRAMGICGSGLLDAAACLLALGVIDESGFMAEPYTLSDGVTLLPSDIRALQLAKGAIRAAVEISGCGEDTPIYMSGSFGSSLSVRSCKRVGLIPKSVREVVPIGNGALRGAELMLVSDEAKKEARRLAEDAEYRELSGDPEFERLFISSLNF